MPAASAKTTKAARAALRGSKKPAASKDACGGVEGTMLLLLPAFPCVGPWTLRASQIVDAMDVARTLCGQVRLRPIDICVPGDGHHVGDSPRGTSGRLCFAITRMSASQTALWLAPGRKSEKWHSVVAPACFDNAQEPSASVAAADDVIERAARALRHGAAGTARAPPGRGRDPPAKEVSARYEAFAQTAASVHARIWQYAAAEAPSPR